MVVVAPNVFQIVHVEKTPPKLEKAPSKVEKAPPKVEKVPPKVEKVHPKVEGVVTYGPWGGSGGSIFDEGIYDGIRQINLSRNVGIVWIRALYDQDGEAIWGCKQGGKGGFKTDKVKLRACKISLLVINLWQYQIWFISGLCA